VGRLPARLRGFEPGERADLVRFRFEEGSLHVAETWLDGERVF
jgi:alpha-D-ribose 1-methylphosphonate 5-triphosphate diphosphatase PhnM